MSPRGVLALAAVAFFTLLGTALASLGGLTQLAGTDGCTSLTGTGGGCATGRAIDNANSVALSPDGEFAYVTGGVSDSIAVFDRAPATGALTQLPGTDGCISETGTGGVCADGRALDGATTVKVSPDGKTVYVSSLISDAIAIFDRNPTTGVLTQLADPNGCISETGTGGVCVDGKRLDGARMVALSPDGEYLYATAIVSNAVTIFDRDPATGSLVQLADPNGCVADVGDGVTCVDGKALNQTVGVTVTPTPGGLTVYVTSAGTTDGVAVFDRSSATGRLTQLSGVDGCITETGSGGACVDGKGLDTPIVPAVDPSGESLYVAGQASNAVAVLDRDTATGKVTQLAGQAGCVSDTGTGGDCADGTALAGVLGLVVSNDGRTVYGAASGTVVGTGAVAIFDRDATTGALAQQAGTAGCISESGDGGACVLGRGLDGAFSVAVSPDDRDVYATAIGSDAVDTFARELPPPPPPPAADTDPPETTITKHPKEKLSKTTAKFEFSSNEPGSTFECQLKGKHAKKKLKKFQPCSSPTKYKKLELGKFKFAVRASDSAGNLDLTPAKQSFKRIPRG